MSNIASVILLGLSLASTSSDPADREAELSAKKCAATYKRMLNFVKYWPPGNQLADDYMMYRSDKIGHRGYDLLGDVYYRGCGAANLAPDKIAAAVWYQNAAVVHLPESQWKLGKMFYEGDGIPQNKEVGITWITSAAIEGSPEAVKYLSSKGEPVPQPVFPNSYMVAAEQSKNKHQAAAVAERARVVRDLANVLVTVGTAYVAAQASMYVAPKAAGTAVQSVAIPKVSTAPRIVGGLNMPPSTLNNPTVSAAASSNSTVGVSSLTSPNVSSMPSLYMTRPAYCNTYANAIPVGDMVYVRVNQFCN